jgi:hypothetical protein
VSDDLRERASWAFTPEFRAAMADACQREFPRIDACYCPQAALMGMVESSPTGARMARWCLTHSFLDLGDWKQHWHFSQAFDHGTDMGTPESALGLLYRRRFPCTV